MRTVKCFTYLTYYLIFEVCHEYLIGLQNKDFDNLLINFMRINVTCYFHMFHAMHSNTTS